MPDFLKDRARKVHSTLLALNESVTALVQKGRLTTDNPKYKQFKAFLNDWGKWYGGTSGSTWFFTAADATLEGYERSTGDWVNYWAKQYPDAAGTLPNAPNTYKPPDLPKLPDIGSAALGVALAGAVALGAFLLLSRR